MSSSKQGQSHNTPLSKESPTVSFVLPDGMPLTPASLLSTASSTTRRQTARSTLLKATRERATFYSGNNNNTVHNDHSSSLLNTPKDVDKSDNSITLLPKSQTISESLCALAITTSKQLEKVWDEIGYTQEERAVELTELLSNFQRLCQDKIEKEQMDASHFRQINIELKDEIRKTSAALKMEADEAFLTRCEMSLQDEALMLDAKLEELRSIADVARRELSKYNEQLVDSHKALGWSLEEYWLDLSSDLTRDRILEFRDKVEEVDAKVQQRTSAIIQLLKDCQDMIKMLRCDTESKELDHKIMNSLVESEDGTLNIVSIFESDSCTGISSDAFDKLTQRLSDLYVEKKERKRVLNELGAQIGELWEKLDVPKEAQRKFAESASISTNGLGMDIIRKGEQELERLRELKSQMMGKLIIEAREKIKGLWNETHATDKQRELFKSILIQSEEEFNDDLLTKHEEYIEVLVTRMEHMRPIIDLIKKREKIVAERMELEEFLKDPDRLKQRGSAFTKQLMKEEKMSRRIKKDLPRYTDLLEKKLQEWANENGEDFPYNGQKYLDVMQRQEDEWLAYKDEQMKMKLEKKQKLRSNNENGGFKRAPSNNCAPLADHTNRARPISRLRAISRGRNNRDEPSKAKPKMRNESRGKTRTESRGRTANASRGRAISATRGWSRPGNR